MAELLGRCCHQTERIYMDTEFLSQYHTQLTTIALSRKRPSLFVWPTFPGVGVFPAIFIKINAFTYHWILNLTTFCVLKWVNVDVLMLTWKSALYWSQPIYGPRTGTHGTWRIASHNWRRFCLPFFVEAGQYWIH